MSAPDSPASAQGAGPPFGRVLTAMVTPFTPDGAPDLALAQKLAHHLVDLGNDGLLLNGATGETSTTTNKEKADLIRAVHEAVGDKALIVAGAGTYGTAHSVELARDAERAGADGLRLVTPSDMWLTQAGLYAHFTTVAKASGLPIMLEDIPAGLGVSLAVDTLRRLAEQPRIVAVKDARGDLVAGSSVIADTDLFYYSGDDALNLPWLAVGGVGVVSVIGHLLADRIGAMIRAHDKGDNATARNVHFELIPVARAASSAGSVVFAKAALRLRGFDAGDPRLPVLPATPEQVAAISAVLIRAGVALETPG